MRSGEWPVPKQYSCLISEQCEKRQRKKIIFMLASNAIMALINDTFKNLSTLTTIKYNAQHS